jgi:hypothetical protein
VVPSATTENACVWPRVNSAEPWVRGAISTSIEIGRICSELRPSGRFFWIAIRSRISVFSSLSNARWALARDSA